MYSHTSSRTKLWILISGIVILTLIFVSPLRHRIDIAVRELLLNIIGFLDMSFPEAKAIDFFLLHLMVI